MSSPVRNGTATLPPPATAAGRERERQPGDDLTHYCATHTTPESVAGCQAGRGCVSFCGIDLSGWRWVGFGDVGDTADVCVVCEDLA